MKIIGETEAGLLLASSRNEVANLLGFYYAGNNKCPELKAGMEIKISEMYHQLRDLAAKKGALTKVAAELRITADLLEIKDPIVSADTDPTKTQEA